MYSFAINPWNNLQYSPRSTQLISHVTAVPLLITTPALDEWSQYLAFLVKIQYVHIEQTGMVLASRITHACNSCKSFWWEGWQIVTATASLNNGSIFTALTRPVPKSPDWGLDVQGKDDVMMFIHGVSRASQPEDGWIHMIVGQPMLRSRRHRFPYLCLPHGPGRQYHRFCGHSSWVLDYFAVGISLTTFWCHAFKFLTGSTCIYFILSFA